MSRVLYGVPFEIYELLGGVNYTADDNGRIDNVSDTDARGLRNAGCIDQTTWLLISAAQAAISNVPKVTGVTIYTLVPTDNTVTFNGAMLVFTASDPVALNVPFGLSLPFRCKFVQAGSGTVTPTAAVGVTINNVNGFVQTSGQYAVMELLAIGQDIYILDGDGSV